jgi:hypothetical protein
VRQQFQTQQKNERTSVYTLNFDKSSGAIEKVILLNELLCCKLTADDYSSVLKRIVLKLSSIQTKCVAVGFVFIKENLIRNKIKLIFLQK